MQEIRHYLFDTENDNLCYVDWFAFYRSLNLKGENGLRRFIKIKDGVSIIQDWPDNAKLVIDNSGKIKKPEDVLGNDSGVLIVNKKIKDVIEEYCKDLHIEYLPFTLCNDKGKEISKDYFVINPIGTYDVLNLLGSDISWGTNGEIYNLKEIILDRGKAKSAPLIFRLQYAPEKIIIGYDLALALHERNFKLLWFKLGYNTNPEISKMLFSLKITKNITYEQLSISHRFIKAVKDNESTKAIALLEQEPILNLFDDFTYGSTALMYAAKNGHVELLKKIIQAGANLNIQGKEGYTALYFALQENKEQSVRVLLEAGANPNLCRTDLLNPEKIVGSPLEYATYRDFKTIVKLLLEAGADPNLPDHNGKIPFHSAKDEEIMQVLLEAGTDVNHYSPYFYSPFHIAAGAGSVTLLQAMLDKGAKINDLDGSARQGPIMNAAYNGKLKNVEFLIANGADVNAKNKNGETAAQCAFENKHFDVLACLVAHGAKVSTEMLQRIQKLQKKREEFAFDNYAKEVANYVGILIKKNSKKIKFEPLYLQVNFGADWGLEWLSLSGKTEKQHFSYRISPEDIDAPSVYNKEDCKKLLKPFLLAHKLKDINLSSVLFRELYKEIEASVLQINDKPISLLLVMDNYDNFTTVTQINKKIFTALQNLVKKPGALKDLAKLCLSDLAVQQEFLQLFNSKKETYAFDDIADSLIKSALAKVLEHQNELKQPVKTLKLVFSDFGAMLPTLVELRFNKGKDIYWKIEIPETPLPNHIDDMIEEDYLLSEFIVKHKLKKDVLSWGDFYEIPTAIWRLELMLAAQEAIKQLQKQGIVFTPETKAYIGYGEDDSDDISGYIGLVQKEIRNKFKNEALLKAFSTLCYKSEVKQQWLQNLINLKVDMSSSLIAHDFGLS